MSLQKISPYLFAFTLFLSAMLVFSVQPMLGKMMLPHVGGSPSGWAVTMFFFQTCLLFGYGLAYVFSKLPPFVNAIAILFMFIPGALFLPIAYQSGLSDSISPFAVFVQLTLSTAVPFLALSTLSPGLQRLFSYGGHATANDPYYLYAASNAGSFVGLLAYPIILEPLVGLQAQSHFWMSLYAILSIAVILCAANIFIQRRDLISLKFQTAKSKVKQKLETAKGDIPVTWSRRFKWIALAAIPSSLMIGVTTEITTDIASAPMIWVIPLGLYLATTIFAFAKRHMINTKALATLHILSIVIISAHTIMGLSFDQSSYAAIVTTLAYLGIFTITALTLHACLANDRPATDRLTEFYFIMALGGAIGGSFNAFIAPLIFNDIYEFQAVLVLSLLLNPDFHKKAPKALGSILKIIILMALILGSLLVFSNIAATYLFIPLTLIIFFASMNARTLLIVATIVFLAITFNKKDYIDVNRNFFGVTKIHDNVVNGNPDLKARIFSHGTTLHGFQAEDPKYMLEPLVYYGVNGPVGDVLAVTNPKDIAVLGLGTGQLACHKKRGRQYTFFEIDQHVIDAALEYFTALKECGYKDLIVGDARLELLKSNQKYDMIFVDTFSSDAIPIHLITTEAINIYLDKLKNNGQIVINISNRHLDLRKPLAAIASEANVDFRYKRYLEKKENPYDMSSEWVVITKNKQTIAKLDGRNWQNIETDMRPWTDDYSNFLSTLKFFNTDVEPSQLTKQEE